MTFVAKRRLIGGRSEQEFLKISWEGEIFGAALFEGIADR